MSSSQQSPNTAKKLTSSFSSPDSFMQDQSNIPTDISISSSIDTTTVATNVVSSSMTTTSLSTAANNTSSSTGGAIKFNQTRDSGFSDSIIEDSSIMKSNKTTTLRTEHGLEVKDSDISLSTNIYANKCTLKSVEEDISIIQPQQQKVDQSNNNKLEELESNLDENGKDYITIVKTTKVTTKVKHVNNKKNKKKNKKSATSTTVSSSPTPNESTSEKMLTEPNEEVKIKNTTTTIAQQVSTATLLITSEDGQIENVIIQEKFKEECSDSSSSKEKIEICQKKSTEELVYETEMKEENLTNNKNNLTLSETLQPQNVDLNSTVLDSEDILSTYSNPAQSPRILTDNANNLNRLNDVTQSVLNQDSTETQQEIRSDENKIVKKEESTKKAKKSRFNLFFKSKSKKNKKDDEVNNQPESPSKKAKIDLTIDTSNNHNFSPILSPISHSTVKYNLLDEEQKDRILYLKPLCADLLLNEFLNYEIIENTKTNTRTQLSYLKENDYRLKIVLEKMILRSLDLLGHDRIESFDKLTQQLKHEYYIVNLENEFTNSKSLNNIKRVYLSNIDNRTCDLVFSNLLKKALMDDKILLKLKLDKEILKPFEEIIEFNHSNNKNNEKLDGDNLNYSLLEQIRLDIIEKIESEKNNNENVEFIIEEKTKMKEEPLRAVGEENKSAAATTQVVVQSNNSQVNSNCGTTPPPTPQNELTNVNLSLKIVEKSRDEKVDLIKVNELLESQSQEEIKKEKDINEGARIVLNTVKEPPIRFPCDDDNFLKDQPIVPLSCNEPDPNLIGSVPVDNETQNSKKAKNKKSSLSCLSCAGGNKMDNETETAPKDEKKKLKGKIKEKQHKKTKLPVKEVEAIKQEPIKTEENLAIVQQEKIVNPALFANLDSKPSDVKEETDIVEAQKIETENFEVENKNDMQNESPKDDQLEQKQNIHILERVVVEVVQENLENANDNKAEDDAQFKKNQIKDETPVIPQCTNESENLILEEPKKEAQEVKIEKNPVKKEKKKNKNKLKIIDLNEEKQEQSSKVQEVLIAPSVDVSVIDIENPIQSTPLEVNKIKDKKTKNKKHKSKNKQEKPETVTKEYDLKGVEIKIEQDKNNYEDKKFKIEVLDESNSKQDEQQKQLDINITRIDTFQVETKSIKNLETNEIIEISQTILNKTESSTIIDSKVEELQEQEPSELNINTEIRIEKEAEHDKQVGGVATEIEKELPKHIEHEKKQIKSSKKKLKDTKKSINEINDREPKVSCFSCKSKKAKKAKNELEKNQDASNLEEITPAKPSIENSKTIDANLFVGLDPSLPSEQNFAVVELPSICLVEVTLPETTKKLDETKVIEAKDNANQIDVSLTINESEEHKIEAKDKANEVDVSLTINESEEHNIEAKVTHSEENLKNEEINVDLIIKEEKNLENLELHKVDIEIETEKLKAVSDINQIDQLVHETEVGSKEPKNLSDDIVVLPDPNERKEIKPTSEALASSDHSKKEKSNIKSKKKSSTFSCFTNKKSKDKNNYDETKAPKVKKSKEKIEDAIADETNFEKIGSEPLEVDLNTNKFENQIKNIDVSNKLSLNENWAVGLDRKEDDPILKKDPINENNQFQNQDKDAIETETEKEEIHENKEIKVEKIEVKEEELKVEVEKTSQDLRLDFGIQNEIIENESEPNRTSSDLLSGAYIKIDRQPDHAVVPIVTENRTYIKSEEATLNFESVNENKTLQKQDKKQKAKTKTSIIDMPLINILNPTKNRKSKKAKNIKSSEVKQTSETEKGDELEKTQPDLIMRPTIIEISNIKLDQPYIETVDVEEEKQAVIDKKDLIETQTEEILTTTIIVEESYKETNLIEETVTKSDDQNTINEKTESKNQIEQPLSGFTIDDKVKAVEFNTTEEIELSPDNKVIDLRTSDESTKLLDREPDIVVLPEINLATERIIEKTKIEKDFLSEQTSSENDHISTKKTKKINKEKKDKKKKTNLVDLPLINILLPKSVKDTDIKESVEIIEENLEEKEVKKENPTDSQYESNLTEKSETNSRKATLPVVELKSVEKNEDQDEKFEEKFVENQEILKESQDDIIIENIENKNKDLLEEQKNIAKDVSIDIKLDNKEVTESKKPSPIDLPLINILNRKEKNFTKVQKDSKVSCFSCRSRKSKKQETESEKTNKEVLEPVIQDNQIQDISIKNNDKIVDLNAGDIRLDAPYDPEHTDKVTSDEQNPELDADILKQKLEKVIQNEIQNRKMNETKDNEPDVQVIEVYNVAQDFKKTSDENDQKDLEDRKNTEETTNNLEQESSSKFEKDSKEETTETKLNDDVFVKASVEVIKIEQSTTVHSDDFSQTVKQETTIVIEDNLDEPGIRIEPVIIPKNMETIEFVKSGQLVVKKEEIPSEELPVIAESPKSTDNYKKKKSDKKKTKKIKDDDEIVASCFSCRSRKAKQSKKTDSLALDSSNLVKDDCETKKLKPEIKIDNNLFKGLDKVPSVSDAEHIVNHQTFLKSGEQIIETVEYNKQDKEEIQLSQKSDVSDNKEIIETTEQIKEIEKKDSQVLDAKENSNEIAEEKIEPNDENPAPQETFQIEDEVDVKPDIIKLPHKPDIVVLPDPNERDIDPISLNLNVETKSIPLNVTVEGKSIKRDKSKNGKIKDKKNQTQTSCFMCRSKKSKSSSLNKPELEAKKEEKIETNMTELVTDLPPPVNITITPAPESEIDINAQPPKKPPRGHIDESFINDDFISENLNIEIAQNSQILIDGSSLPEIKNEEITNDETVEIGIKKISEEISEIISEKKENNENMHITKTEETVFKEINQEKEIQDISFLPVETEITLNEKKSDNIELPTIKSSSEKELKEIEISPENEKFEKQSEKTKRKGLTSIIDLPLIEILKPKDINKERSKKAKEKKDKKAKVNFESKEKEENKTESIQKSEPVQDSHNSELICHQDYFKGLDPIRVKSPGYEVDKKDYDDVLLKDLSQNIVESKIESELKKEALQIINNIESEIKIETKPIEQPLSLDLPSVIDIEYKSDYKYVSPGRVENWTTDPLPCVQIGLHKVNFSKPIENENQKSLNESSKKDLNIRDQKNAESKKEAIEEKQNKKSITQEKVELTIEKQDEKQLQTIEFPSSYIAEIIDTSAKRLAVENKELNEKDIKTEEFIKEFSQDEKKKIKANKKHIIQYLKLKLNCTKQQLIDSQYQESESKQKKLTKESQAKEKLYTKLIEKSLKTLCKKDTKSLTFTELSKKLEKEIKKKSALTEEIQKSIIDQLRIEINNGTLLQSAKDDAIEKNKTKLDSTTLNKDDSSNKLDSKSSSLDKLSDQPGVMKRFPSLTWREANERARILFYKGRVPSIRYNEKRDSFRVSMIQQINTADGKEKTTEVPVYDEDVRRLLNSCGLYWDGESISLLNKSDEIFLKAQQEAFQIIKSMSGNFNQNEFISFSDSGITSLSGYINNMNKSYTTTTVTTTTTSASTSSAKHESYKSSSNTESITHTTIISQENSKN